MAQVEELNATEIKQKIRTFVVEHFLMGESSKKLADDDSFLENGVIDSTGVLELVSFIEEAFNFRVEDEELIPDNLDSLNKLTVYIQKKINLNNSNV